jgi:hypothetical protein
VIASGEYYILDVYAAGKLWNRRYITPSTGFEDMLVERTSVVANAACPPYACKFNGLRFREMTNVEKLTSGLLEKV